MKKIILLLIQSCFAFVSLFAQHDHSDHQKQNQSTKADTAKSIISETSQKQLSKLLTSYYNIKNALVAGDATSASTNAGELLRTANSIDFKVLSEGNIHILSKDAGRISDSKDLQKQREYFANLSANIAIVARSLKLIDQPIYLQYCPMKKASWLSSEKEIRNPYYGSSMLTCGEVTETF
ncbi:MAG: DUF3347 domain-containing protein [Flavisolibacter sp.]